MFELNTKAQFILEHTYDSAATWNTCQGNINQLMLVKFETLGEKYIKINECGKSMKLYDLNHSLVKSISLASVPLQNNVVGDILYISEKLFNTDNKIEFMYLVSTSNFYSTIIYNELGNVLFTDSGAPLVVPHWHNQHYPIYNTSQGTKMILSYRNGMAKVFSLAGTLSTSIQKLNDQLLENSDFNLSNPQPNPNSNQTIINYVLPEGIKEAEMIFFDMQGKEVKRYKIDDTFNSLVVSTSDISAGTYFYQMEAKGKASGTKKMVVVK
jgi:hypothetical protein